MRVDDDPRQDLEYFDDEEIIEAKIQEKLERFPDNRCTLRSAHACVRACMRVCAWRRGLRC
jgi:hypothetical protein